MSRKPCSKTPISGDPLKLEGPLGCCFRGDGHIFWSSSTPKNGFSQNDDPFYNHFQLLKSIQIKLIFSIQFFQNHKMRSELWNPSFRDISNVNREMYTYQGTIIYCCPAFDVHRKSRSMLHFLLSCDVNDQNRMDTTSRRRWLEKLGGWPIGNGSGKRFNW